MPRHTVIDRYAFGERAAIMELAAEAEDTLRIHGGMWPFQQANASASRLPFSRAATAAANGDWMLARLLCAQEHDRHGLDWALELWQEIGAAVDDAHALDPPAR